MNFPKGVIYIWAGTNANIPAGWERVTALDGKYPKGAADGVDPNVTGGSATHSHTSSSHTHTIAAHTHTITIAACQSNSKSDKSGSVMARDAHTHAPFNSGAVSNANISSEAATYSAISNDPPYYSVIFIRPTAPKPSLPNLGVYLYDGSDSKSGHYVCDGNNSTPNLANKYLKGAATDADAGATGGSTTNIHNLTHTHTVSHAHAAATSPSSGGIGAATSGGGWIYTHTHDIALDASTTAPSNTPSLTTTETVEPAYKKLLTVQNRTGHGDIRLGMIGMWLGTLSSIPANYALCDGNNGTQDMRGKHLKSTATTGEVGNTGGSNTHTHAAQAHEHSVSHTHTANPPAPGHTNTNSNRTGESTYDCGQDYTKIHPSVAVSSDNYSLASTNTTANSSSNEPEYRTVAFIKLKSLSGGGAFLLNMI